MFHDSKSNFDSGEISRVLVSSPWMPPVCESCKEIGHVTRRCPSSVAAKPCSRCKSLTHITANCPQKQSQDPQKNNPEPTKRKTRRSKSRGKQIWKRVDQVNLPQTEAPRTEAPPPIASTDYQHTEIVKHSKLGTGCDREIGETSETPSYLKVSRPGSGSGISRSSKSDLPSDSSDVETSD